MRAVSLPSNRPADRFYRGGPQIAAFRGIDGVGDHEPEDWVASVTTLAGETERGYSRLPDGRLLVDAIRDDPVGWLGPEHVARFGTDPRLLVKLLDAGERLPMHAHPSGTFASQHLGRAHGKAEAWFIVAGGRVHLGLRDDLPASELARLVATQDTDSLLAALNVREVGPGDVVFVPAGQLHAIGARVFLVELQEPEDLSILVEWKGFELDGESDGHLGLGFDVALEAVDRRRLAEPAVNGLVRPAGFGESVLPVGADAFFRLERHGVDGGCELSAGFSVLVVTDGSVSLDDGQAALDRGSTVVIPHAAGEVALQGSGEVLVCRPPAVPQE
jgi:mannose-6-phosphate isomerase